jgi:hypothetical protein
MVNEFRYSVISPETGIQKRAGELPPGMGETVTPKMAFARRLDALENKTIYLVDIGFGGGYNFMVQLQNWFAKNMPSVTTIVRRKPGRVFANESKELWDEVKQKGHAVVLGVAG